MTDLIQKEKAKFFSLYMGQKVLFSKYESHPVLIPVLGVCTWDEWALKLKSIDNVSEEHKKIFYQETGTEFSSGDFKICIYRWSIPHIIWAIDFFRSNGYYIGNGKEIEMGWVELI